MADITIPIPLNPSVEGTSAANWPDSFSAASPGSYYPQTDVSFVPSSYDFAPVSGSAPSWGVHPSSTYDIPVALQAPSCILPSKSPNRFILFRKHFISVARKSGACTQQDISKMASMAWRALSDSQKKMWEQRAEAAKRALAALRGEQSESRAHKKAKRKAPKTFSSMPAHPSYYPAAGGSFLQGPATGYSPHLSIPMTESYGALTPIDREPEQTFPGSGDVSFPFLYPNPSSAPSQSLHLTPHELPSFGAPPATPPSSGTWESDGALDWSPSSNGSSVSPKEDDLWWLLE